MTEVLYVTTRPIQKIDSETVKSYSNASVSFLDLSDSGTETTLPTSWKRVLARVIFNPDDFREDFLSFLDHWPSIPIWKGKDFDQLFRRRDGYSVWWTGAGATRTPRNTPVPELKAIWVFDQALRSGDYDVVALCSDCPKLAHSIQSRCHSDDIRFVTVANSVLPQPWQGPGFKWTVRQIVRLFIKLKNAISLWLVARSSVSIRRETEAERSRPAILFRPKISRNLALDDGKPHAPFWSEVCKELEKRCPTLRIRYLLNPDMVEEHGGLGRWLRDSGNDLLSTFEGAIPLLDSFLGLRGWTVAFPEQIRCLFRFSKVSRTDQFCHSFQFAGANVASIYGPLIQRSMVTYAEWEREVERLTDCMRFVGNLRAVFALAEFYRTWMPGIAAAKRLGIPVVGVQHGNVHPMHLTYTLPPGHVQGAPVPDFFAAYGEYAEEVVSRLGAFPAGRLWRCGTGRLDYLVKNPPDQHSARQRLGLPLDCDVVLVTTQTYRWFPKTVEAVLELTKDKTDCFVCIKAHYGDRKRIDQYKLMAKNLEHTNVEFYLDSFNDLLASCSILISASSTTILEACLLNRPTICVNFSDEADRYPYVEDGASLPGRTLEELKTSLDLALSKDMDSSLQERRKAFLSRHAGPTSRGEGAATLAEQFVTNCME